MTLVETPKIALAFLACGALAACFSQNSLSAPCTRIKLEQVGEIEIVDRYIKTPLWGGRGPYGSALAIYVDTKELGLQSNLSRQAKVTIFPSEAAPVESNKELHSRCSMISNEGRKYAACNVDLTNAPVFLRIVFPEALTGDSDAGLFSARAISIAKDFQEKAFVCSSSKEWVGAP